jgi:uncharacterized protein (DUF983 family)
MDYSCPSCGEDLARRYLGISARCLKCRAYLAHYTHPAEDRLWLLEPAGYVFAFVGMALAAVFARGHAVIAAIVVVAWLSFGVFLLLRLLNSVPDTWPRWRLAVGHRKRPTPGGEHRES